MTQKSQTSNIQRIVSLLKTLEEHACSCDLGYGYACPAHSAIRESQELRRRLEQGLVPTETRQEREARLGGLAPSYFISESLVQDLLEEVRRGVIKWGDYDSLDQARFVIQDEVHEMWMEIRAPQKDFTKIRAEALQVAATALRLCEEIDQGRFESK